MRIVCRICDTTRYAHLDEGVCGCGSVGFRFASEQPRNGTAEESALILADCLGDIDRVTAGVVEAALRLLYELRIVDASPQLWSLISLLDLLDDAEEVMESGRLYA